MSSRTRANSPYAPIRYEATRAFAPREFDIDASGRKSLPFNQIYAAAEKAGVSPTSNNVLYEKYWAEQFSQFCMAGRTIYDVKPGLLSALAQTDIEDVPCGLLSPPSCYIHVGCPDVRSALTPHSISKEMDGAYVRPLDLPRPMIGVFIVTKAIFCEKAFHRSRDSTVEKAAFLIDIADPALPLNQAIRNACSLNANALKVPQGCDDIGKFRDDQCAICVRVLSLLVAAILYLSTDQSDVEQGWQEGVPPSLLEKYTSARSINLRQTADRAITHDGYVKVYHTGRKFAASAEGASYISAMREGRLVSTHLRRGHLRRQRHGEAHSLTKIIWIPPVIINEGQTPTRGHIHVHKGPQPDQG